MGEQLIVIIENRKSYRKNSRKYASFIMWQEIVAIDTKINDHRMMESKDLRPLYLKRRLQLLQNKAQNHTQPRKSVVSHPEYPDPDQLVMRNKKYISLRVKLLKKQFGLPADIVSLRSLNLQSSSGTTPQVKPSNPSSATTSSDDH